MAFRRVTANGTPGRAFPTGQFLTVVHRDSVTLARFVSEFHGMTRRWHSTPHGYDLKHAGLTGILKLDESNPGLRNVTPPFADGCTEWPGPLLALRSAQASGKRPGKVQVGNERPSQRLRNNTVDIQLAAPRNWPTRLHLYWGARYAGQIELQVLASTPEPIEGLEVLTFSQVPFSEVMVPVGHNTTQWIDLQDAARVHRNWLVVPRDSAAASLSLDGRFPRFGEMTIWSAYRIPVVLFRPPNQQWSYVEMSHPEDCSRIIARVRRGSAQVCFGLFGLDLEKGVILRGRVRAAFIDRKDDMEHVAELYHEFSVADPPLSV